MTRPTISVAMSVYDSGPFLRPAIESILSQTFTDFEFLIVNDGSRDGSGAVIDDYARADSRIVAIHQENRGLVSSLNRMIAMARAPWIARMDSDDIALPDRFAKQIAFFDDNPDHGLLGANSFIIDTTGDRLDRPPVSRPLCHDDIVANFRDGVNLHHPTIMVRTDLMRNVGGYRAQFRFAQDYDLYLRLIPHTKMANLNDPLLEYRVHSDQAGTKHLFDQTLSSVVAWLSHEARMAGRPDPVDTFDTLPQIGTLDAVFETRGADSFARSRILERIIYSPDILAGEGYDVLIGHVRETGARPHLWRVVPRLARAGHFTHAARLGAALVAA